jgi:hypothetical protein
MNRHTIAATLAVAAAFGGGAMNSYGYSQRGSGRGDAPGKKANRDARKRKAKIATASRRRNRK